MKQQPEGGLDLVGFSYEEAQRLLKRAGYRVQTKPENPPVPRPWRVIRQRLLEARVVELTLGQEIDTDSSLSEKEVKKDALQDNR